MTKQHLLGTLDRISREQLRKARARIDVMGMWIWMSFWAVILMSDINRVNIYVFTDASPQRRGREMYASSFELFWDSELWRRMFPNTTPIDMTLNGKLTALLFQMVLSFGPDLSVLDIFTTRIRSIVSDSGTERLTSAP